MRLWTLSFTHTHIHTVLRFSCAQTSVRACVCACAPPLAPLFLFFLSSPSPHRRLSSLVLSSSCSTWRGRRVSYTPTFSLAGKLACCCCVGRAVLGDPRQLAVSLPPPPSHCCVFSFFDGFLRCAFVSVCRKSVRGWVAPCRAVPCLWRARPVHHRPRAAPERRRRRKSTRARSGPVKEIGDVKDGVLEARRTRESGGTTVIVFGGISRLAGVDLFAFSSLFSARATREREGEVGRPARNRRRKLSRCPSPPPATPSC